MALIVCPECGKSFSDYADTCPSCGLDVNKAKEIISKRGEIIECPDCGVVFTAEHDTCPICGLPIEIAKKLNEGKPSVETCIECVTVYNGGDINNLQYELATKEIEVLAKEQAFDNSDFAITQKPVRQKSKKALIASVVSVFIIVALLVFVLVINPIIKEKAAQKQEAQKIQEAQKKQEAYDLAYNSAIELLSNEKFDEALLILNDIQTENASAIIAKSKYEHALAYCDAFDFSKAEKLLAGVDYNDSAELLKSIQAYTTLVANANVGNVITFGKFEQDNVIDNGPEDIEWIVLKKEGDKALIISKYCLFRRDLNDTERSYYWETCDLRKWLNADFLDNSFSKFEKSFLVPAEVNDGSGRVVTDMVFILSLKQAKELFNNNKARQSENTAYAFSFDKKSRKSYGNQAWYLCTKTDVDNITADGVGIGGDFYEFCATDDGRIHSIYVRPVLWIKLYE